MTGRLRITDAQHRVATAEARLHDADAKLTAALDATTGAVTAQTYDDIAVAAATVAEAIRTLGFFRADLARIIAVEAGADA